MQKKPRKKAKKCLASALCTKTRKNFQQNAFWTFPESFQRETASKFNRIFVKIWPGIPQTGCRAIYFLIYDPYQKHIIHFMKNVLT